MRRRGLVGTAVIAVVVVLLAIALAAVWFVTKNYVVLGWQLFPKHQQVLDLRQRAITTAEYDTLSWKMPDSKILWSIPFQGNYYEQDATELSIQELDEVSIQTIAYFRNLEVIHADACKDYADLVRLTKDYPNVKVEYSVSIGGEDFPSDAEEITVKSLPLEEAGKLAYLPKLQAIDAVECRDFEVLRQVQLRRPQWKIKVLDSIAGTPISADTTSLEVTGATYEELSVGMAAMPNLKSVMVHRPASDGVSMLQLREEYPNVDIHWELTYNGSTYREDTTEVDISSAPISSIAEAKEAASKFPKLEKLIVNSGSISNDDMAAYRDEVRDDYKVVWTVDFTPKCQARTDDTYFMPIKQGEYYFQDKNSYNLRYCEDLICIDLGHSTVKDISFVSYMPHLKYLILAWTQVTDISPLSSCKELVYLELDHGIIHDFTPLQGCTALEDLNVNDRMAGASIEPLCSMTWLKNLWATDLKYADRILLTESLPNTRVVTTEVSSATGMGWRNLQNYYDMRDCLGMYYMD